VIGVTSDKREGRISDSVIRPTGLPTDPAAIEALRALSSRLL